MRVEEAQRCRMTRRQENPTYSAQNICLSPLNQNMVVITESTVNIQKRFMSLLYELEKWTIVTTQQQKSGLK